MILSVDIETYSAVDLTKSTVYRYSEDPSFEILLFGYAIDDNPVTVLDLTEQPLPQDIVSMLKDPGVIKYAYNANFERVCLSRYLVQDPLNQYAYLPPEQWRCTMVHALTCGLPRSLKDVGAALGLPEDQAKMREGTALITYFCKPCKATKKNALRTRNIPENAPDKWKTFIEYNRRDVEVERTIRKILEEKPVPDAEWRAYWMDQRINDRGVLCDRKLVSAAIEISRAHTEKLTREAIELTGLENPNSVAQLKAWLGIEGSLNKKAITEMRDSGNLDLRQDRLLAIRQEMGKTSISKYEAMERGMCGDDRIRGLFQFYGAARTGRWAGRQVQVQNLPQNKLPELDLARRYVLERDGDAIQYMFGNIPDTLSQLIRTAFTGGEGRTLAVADFSSIEARLLSWYADERWRMDVFRSGGDIYCASASQMFRVPVEKHGINGHLRQKGKIAELALGYGGSVGALKQMGAMEMGLKEEELQPLVDLWRGASPKITAFWWDVDKMVRDAVSNPGTIQRMICAGGRADLLAKCDRTMLSIRIPSGRCIRYWHPGLGVNKFGSESITYEGSEAGKWSVLETYGPKLVENIVQATARDCLRDAMYYVSKKYPNIVMHVHDEMILDVPEALAEDALQHMQMIMGAELPWAPGLLLRGDGYITKHYRKD